MTCPKCGSFVDDGKNNCPVCGADVAQKPAGRPVREGPDMPMKWFKFLIYFALWAGAALLVIQGVGYITGAVYNDSSGFGAGTVYGTYPGMRLWDRIYGGAFVCLGAFNIVTRFALARFKKIGPTLLYLAYGIQGGLALLSAIVVSVITGSNGVILSAGSLIAAAALILLNRSYFKARQELFIN